MEVGIRRNLWATQQSGLLAPKRMNFPLDSLVLYLPLWHPELSGNSIVSKDLNAITGTVTGAVHVPPTHRAFDGDDDITLGDNAIFELQNFTLISWNYITSSVAHSTSINLQVDRASPQSGIETLLSNTRTIYLRVTDSSNTIVNIITDDTFNLNEWFFTAFTKSGTAAKIYLDGALSKSVTLADSVVGYIAGHETRVGCSWSTSAKNTFTVGRHGEILVFDRGLTANEILHIHRQTKWRYL